MRETLNLKLLFLYFAKKFYYILLCALAGALILGGGYFLSRYVFSPAPDYVAKSEIYLTYADDVRMENIYINDYTWSTLAASDACVEEAKKNLSFDADSQYLKTVATAGLESDVRLLVITVTDPDPEKAVKIANAYETAIVKMTEKMDDITDAQVFTSAKDAQVKQFDDRTLRMSLTGCIVGALFGIALLLFVFATDDSVFIPSQTKEKLALTTVLCLGKDNKAISDWEKNAAALNFKEILEGKKKVYLSDISAEKGCAKEDISAQLNAVKALLSNPEILDAADGINQNPEAAEVLKESDGVLLLLKAGGRNAKMAERAVSFLETQQIPVLGCILYHVDSKWILRYLSGRK